MRSLRIVFAVHAYKPAYRVGGPVISVSALAEKLVERGHDVTVFTSNSNLDEELDVPLGQPVDIEGVHVRYFKPKERLTRWLFFVPYLSKSMGFLYSPIMRDQLESVVPTVQVVHTHLPFVYPTYAAARAAFRHGKPLFYHQRSAFDAGRLRFRALKKRLYIAAVERPIMRKATTLIALTAAEQASYRALGVDTPCRIIPNGVDVTQYRDTPDVGVNARWRIPTGAIVILFMGRLHPNKGADKLLRAFLSIQARFPETVLVIAGPDERGLERRLRDLVREAGVTTRVVFPGMVGGIEKRDLLARADLFCLPSEGEGFSMAVLEALASATPVLLSAGCHFPEAQAAGVGRIAPTEPGALANVLSDILQEPAVLHRMGRRGREFVAQNYSWDSVVDQTLATYVEGIDRLQRTRA